MICISSNNIDTLFLRPSPNFETFTPLQNIHATSDLHFTSRPSLHFKTFTPLKDLHSTSRPSLHLKTFTSLLDLHSTSRLSLYFRSSLHFTFFSTLFLLHTPPISVSLTWSHQ